MSCNYAEGLSEYEHKGILGAKEKFDTDEVVDKKCETLADWIRNARHVVVHTGAGISTSAGIPDFRGPKGVWTLEKEGKKPEINISFDDAAPTKTHMAIKALLDHNIVKYVVSQNIDGLHLKSGVQREFLAELHGNMYTEQCDTCASQFVRTTATTTVGQKELGESCRRSKIKRRACRGKLKDTILDWEASLPDLDLEMSDFHSSVADLNICLGTTLQIVPSGNLPLRNKKYGGKVVIINLQPTKHDKKADLIINTYVDTVMDKISKKLGVEIPEYEKKLDPTKNQNEDSVILWDITKDNIKNVKDLYNLYCKNKKLKTVHKKSENTEPKEPKLDNTENLIK